MELEGSGVPQSLDGWTLDVVRSLLTHGVFESDRFDFKHDLPRDEHGKQRLRGAIAAFANSGGGFIVLGIHDDRSRSLEERMIGIANTRDIPEMLGALASRIDPSADYSFKNPPLRLHDQTRFIHIIYIPASRRGPHGIELDGRWWFPKRTSRGTEAMSRTEIGSAFVDLRQRTATARMIEVEINRIARLAENLNRNAYHTTGTFVPPALYLAHYRSTALAGALPFVISEVDDQSAVRSFQEILDATTSSDLLAAQLGAQRASGLLNEGEVDWAAELMRDYARRTANECQQFNERSAALRHLSKP